MSSSLKFCILAEGKADLYPRLNSISKWDIAAGDAILRSAGGVVLNDKGKEYLYNTNEVETGEFYAIATKQVFPSRQTDSLEHGHTVNKLTREPAPPARPRAPAPAHQKRERPWAPAAPASRGAASAGGSVCRPSRP